MCVIEDSSKKKSVSQSSSKPDQNVSSAISGSTTYFLTLNATNGKFRISATQYPLTRNSAVKTACTAASGIM